MPTLGVKLKAIRHANRDGLTQAAKLVIRNVSESSFDWTIGDDVDWLDYSVTSGTLEADSSVTIDVTPNSNAAALAGRRNLATITVTNTTADPDEEVEYEYNLDVIAGALTAVTQGEITWTFDQAYECGQFVNGDWWVLDDGGGVTVDSVSPAPTGSGSSYRNGTMKNPTPGTVLGYDGRLPGYNAGQNVSYPAALAGGDALCSVKSIESSAGQVDVSGYTIVLDDHCFITDAAVLTCLSTAPPADAFRPAYFTGATKTIHRVADMAAQLASLPTLGKETLYPTDLGVIADQVARVWLDHYSGFNGRKMHPIFNMPNYGREINEVTAVAALVLVSDYPLAEKLSIARGLVQIGIDCYGVIEAGGTFLEGGAHTQGRKLPVMVAGYLLDDAGLLDVESVEANQFAEDGQTFTIAQADVDRTLRNEVSGNITAAGASTCTLGDLDPNHFSNDDHMVGNDIEVGGQRRTITSYNTTTNEATVDSPWSPGLGGSEAYVGIGYESGDIATAEWSEYHYTAPQHDNPSLSAPYRVDAGSGWLGAALVCLALGIDDDWGAGGDFFAYVDRYGSLFNPSTWQKEMWDEHRGSY